MLDNAAGLDQVHPLLTETPGCPVLVTSRRSLTGLHPATHLTVDVFSPDEAVAFLAIAAPRIPVGRDSNAAARIAGRCGHLPLALGLVAGHMQATPGWTLTDHADRLDERHRDRHLDAGVALALDLSYHHLPTDQQRLLRLLALHPGQDLDAYAAAALTGVDLPTAGTQLLRLCADHLLQPAAPGRYAFHDLVRAYAASRARDEDPPLVRRAALTRLFDHYLATAAAAMDALAPAEAHRRPRIPAPGSPVPVLTDSDTARTWLDAARPTLVTIAAHTAAHGWASHTTRLSITLYRYLNGGHPSDALTIHAHARHAAEHIGDLAAQAHAHNGIGTAHLQLSQYRTATAHLRRALDLFRQADDRPSQARVLTNLCLVDTWLCRYQSAARHADDALTLWRLVGDPTGEARALINLGVLEKRQGQYRTAADHHTQALALCRQTGDRGAEATALFSLADVEVWLGWYVRAADHLHQARALYRQLGNRGGEAWTLDSLGTLHTRLNQPAQAIEYHQQALAVFRATGDSNSVACALNGLGEATSAAGRPADALAHHTAAHTLAANVGDREQQARAHAGLGRIHHALANPARAYEHYQQALNIYTDLGMPQADQIHLWIRS